ncbi:MAG: potassium/proton antiporter [Nocardioidaceae bacterium]|nr:potassium/proton antiporter [Nocardioidaceae bacterium]
MQGDEIGVLLLIGAAVLLAAILAVRVSVFAGLPSLLLYLAIGLLLGESVIGIEFEDADLAYVLAIVGLVLILTEGGLTTRWSEVRPVMPLALLLSTLGVAVGITVMALFGRFVLDLDWQLAVLLGAVTAPTDAAAVFSVLRRMPLRANMRGALEAESGLNDAPTLLLVTLVSTGEAGDHSWYVVAGIVALELVLGGTVGVLLGWLGARGLARAALPASGLYPLAILSLCVVAYGAAVVAHGSGFAAVYAAALILGNADLPHRAATRSFAEGVGWLAQIGLFVMLGLLASPGRLEWWHVGAGLAAGAVLVVIARPLSVVACAAPLRIPAREQAFLSWAGLRGAVPIVLTTIPLAEDVPGARDLFDLVLVLVLVYTFVQGPTLPWAADRLAVSTHGEPRDLDVEAAPLEGIAADLLHVRVLARSRLHGVEIAELRLPEGSSVSLVVRDGRSFVPHLRTRLTRGDEILVVTPRNVREATETRLRAVAEHGRLAGWAHRGRPGRGVR